MSHNSRLGALVGVACSLVGITAPTAAHAAGMFGVDTNKTPSVITYGFRGMGTGALLGLSASYLVIRNSDSDDDLTLFLTTTGISALVGAGTGIAIGLFDLKSNRPGVGGIMLRDTLYGTLLGGLVGLTVGGIVALNGGEGEDLALGASIGSLVGAGAGLVIGAIEGPRIVDSYRHRHYTRNWGLNLRPVRDISQGLVWLPSLGGHF